MTPQPQWVGIDVSKTRLDVYLRPSAQKAVYTRLLEHGKAKKVALGACRHKLLRMLNAMIRDAQSWNPPPVPSPSA